MPAKRRFSSINLVPKDEFDESVLGKVLKWSLTAGRSIVVLTEFVVILAFLSRFKLDRDLNDINEVIEQKQAIVASYAEVEKQARKIQDRIAIIDKGESARLNADKLLTEVRNKTALDVSYSAINLSRDSLDVEGVAGSEASFAILIDKLKNESEYTDLTVTEVEFNQRQGGVSFKVAAKRPGNRFKPTVTNTKGETDEL